MFYLDFLKILTTVCHHEEVCLVKDLRVLFTMQTLAKHTYEKARIQRNADIVQILHYLSNATQGYLRVLNLGYSTSTLLAILDNFHIGTIPDEVFMNMTLKRR